MTAHWRTPAGLHVASARLPNEGELPSLDGVTGWLNSPPLTWYSGRARSGVRLPRTWSAWVSRSGRSWHRTPALAGGTDWRAADAADPEAAADAAKGASVVYHYVNAPYAQWPSSSRRCSGGCWLLPSAPVRCWWC